MPSRGSHSDTDQITWQSAALPLGTYGLDLRTPIEPTALADLLNARFQDDRTVLQRDGHDASEVRDASDIAPLGTTFHVTSDWVFGHGVVVRR
jgi:hypothetical protein